MRVSIKLIGTGISSSWNFREVRPNSSPNADKFNISKESVYVAKLLKKSKSSSITFLTWVMRSQVTITSSFTKTIKDTGMCPSRKSPEKSKVSFSSLSSFSLSLTISKILS